MPVPKCRHALVYLGNEKPTDKQHLRKSQRLYSRVVWCLCSPAHSVKHLVKCLVKAISFFTDPDVK